MNKVILGGVLIFLGANVYAQQDLPQNPEPGKCYVRCTTPDVYENQTVQVKITPEYKKLKTFPATYETVTEKVIVKEASKKLTVVAAKYKTETVTFMKKQGASTLKVIPAKLGPSSESVEIKPAYAQWELGSPAPDCASSNPDDCRYWCYKGYPAEFTTIPVKVLGSDATTTSSSIAEQSATYTKRVLVEPARVIEEEIPAEYGTITKTVLVKDAYTEEVIVPATFKDVTKEVLTQKGGLTTWKEVECSLVEYSALPINWNLGSATLTAQAKSIIDTRLMPVLANNPGAKMEIASHTDARGSKSNNKELSDRRAQSVVSYLITKGINASRLVANGYGETRLKNRCADGVTCTERQHASNRRTEFRLIQ
ncbi:cell envelope biogenesis protein OmpA [Aquimarina aggregata]|uniref:Cell envelope biogenesis protein OmpA n=1 Tax=Aquimarina aggregata TaxID=1642818 RepID=A0A162CXR2_9FLAO|nr:OmpA family protein [Aquimarina aggregata]KZS42649.1 cell envelope biogenesis protein OmpA [Aquimarina aggregata]